MRVQPPTPRQLDVLRCMADGLSGKEICRVLNIAFGTYKTHSKFLFYALGVCSRGEAVMEGVRLGYLDPKAPPKHQHVPMRRIV